VGGFEPPAFPPQTECSARLSYTPTGIESSHSFFTKSVHAWRRARKYVSFVRTVSTPYRERNFLPLSWLLFDFALTAISHGFDPDETAPELAYLIEILVGVIQNGEVELARRQTPDP
jgi:hypothetical protein